MEQKRNLNIGFVSTRLAGTDGVSLEADKWVTVLEKEGHDCFYFAGEIDYPVEKTFCILEAHFRHEQVKSIHDRAFSTDARDPELNREIREVSDYLKFKLHEFIDQFNIELLIVQNALAIPMNIPLGIGIAECVAESSIPTIAHHHDFFWERERFLHNSIPDYLDAAFPPRRSSINHVTINKPATKNLALRRGLSATIVPNVMDYDNLPVPRNNSKKLREALGIDEEETMVLQPTRIVKRKRIEIAIDLVQQLNRKACLVITHEAGDEGKEYADWLVKFAGYLGVRLIFADSMIIDDDTQYNEAKAQFTLADMYNAADLVTFTSDYEGFGNALLEAIYYKKPLVVNNYMVYRTDIKPTGLDVVELDGFVTQDVVDQVNILLSDEHRRQEMVEHNYQIGLKYFSYTVLKHKLDYLINTALRHQ